MNVFQAQTLRTELQELLDKAADLRDLREPLAGSERAAVTRQITPLEKRLDEISIQLKDAPPPPLSPTEAVDRLRRAHRTSTPAAKARAEKRFYEYADKYGLHSAITDASDIVGTIELCRIYHRFHTIEAEDGDELALFVKLYKAAPKLRAKVGERMRRLAFSRSTSRLTNAAKVDAAEFLDSYLTLDSGFIEDGLVRLYGMVESWAILEGHAARWAELTQETPATP